MPETCTDIYDNKSQLLHQVDTSHHLQGLVCQTRLKESCFAPPE
jgi:hypothetical protein